ncbi:short-chain dehydrogenase [Sporosarcina sp. E16_3]|uniref:short-chain dehydrogenase n=1 Tax=Sporosarcina sp. E16_3 TaxID=2789293 RepID=UPI001A90F7D7|nr:short-chain dehydrogenase [Sporosarcina sp. E16_3]MBO0603096.1 short-chain dehydrogenase [Sporosarcina sp. E16_3]
MKRNDHALVIGGTGMLAGVCIHLAREDYSVSVIGRTLSKFKRLIVESPPNSIFPLTTDYDTDDVYVEINKAIRERGPFDLIISWTPNYSMLERICEMNPGKSPFRLVHVKGSGRYFQDEPIRIPSLCSYRKVFLGFVKEESGSRWLTLDEIANGVIKQIETNEEVRIIGQIHPYKARPR